MSHIADFEKVPDPLLLWDFDREVGLDGVYTGEIDFKIDDGEAEFGLNLIVDNAEQFETYYPLVPLFQQIINGRYDPDHNVTQDIAEKKALEICQKIGAKKTATVNIDGVILKPIIDDDEAALNNYLRKYGSSMRLFCSSGPVAYGGAAIFEKPVKAGSRLVWVSAFPSSMAYPYAGHNRMMGEIAVYNGAVENLIWSKLTPMRKGVGGAQGRIIAGLKIAQLTLGLDGRRLDTLQDEELLSLARVTVNHELTHYERLDSLPIEYQLLWLISNAAKWKWMFNLDEIAVESQNLIDALEGKIEGIESDRAVAYLYLENSPDPHALGHFRTFDGFIIMHAMIDAIGNNSYDADKMRTSIGKIKKKADQITQTVLEPNGVVLSSLRDSWGGEEFGVAYPALVRRAVEDFNKKGIVFSEGDIDLNLLSRSIVYHLINDKNRDNYRKINSTLEQYQNELQQWIKAEFNTPELFYK
ncbi:MAG: hypothetical protein HYT75_01980 [Deltaproteobacteria bacterium]|nr:hypothetical protein [Deltaproteobacteria bacterium]